MPTPPKPTKKQRRDAGRTLRATMAQKEAAGAKRQGRVNLALAMSIAGFVGWGVTVGWVEAQPTLTEPIVLKHTEVEQAMQNAGCQLLVQDQPYEDRWHYTITEAPPADAIYQGIRPTHSGPHTWNTATVFKRGTTRTLDERTSTHSMEHGAIVFWVDDDLVDADPEQVSEMMTTTEDLNRSGFITSGSMGGGVGILSGAFEGEFTSGKPFAFRAWGQAMDCDRFDRTVAYSWVLHHFSTHGRAPERAMAVFPDELMAYDPNDAHPALGVDRNSIGEPIFPGQPADNGDGPSGEPGAQGS